jgi:hypothetical protein
MLFGKSKIKVSQLGLNLAENFNGRVPLDFFKKNVGIDINISEEDAFLVILSMSTFSLNRAMDSIHFDKILTTEMKHKIIDFYFPTTLMKNNIFKSDVGDLNHYMDKSATTAEKLFDVFNNNLNSSPSPYWYVSKEVFSMLDTKSNIPDVFALTEIATYMSNELTYFYEFIKKMSKKYNFDVEGF